MWRINDPEDSVIERFSAPHKLDHAPRGTICKVMKDGKVIDLYLQVSDDVDNPIWIHRESIT